MPPEEDEPFKFHPNLSDKINANIAESELLGGARLDQLKIGDKLKVITQNHIYVIEKRDDGYYISGHPEYCPTPTLARIAGSTWGGTMLKINFVGRGMHLEYKRPEDGVFTAITTLQIKDVRRLP